MKIIVILIHFFRSGVRRFHSVPCDFVFFAIVTSGLGGGGDYKDNETSFNVKYTSNRHIIVCKNY